MRIFFAFNTKYFQRSIESMDLDLKEVRNRLEMTQTELAEKLGVSMRTVQNWEKGINKIPKSAITVLLSLEKNTEISHQLNDISVTYLSAETSSIMHVPLVNQYAYAGYMAGFGDPEYIESLPRIPFVLDKEYRGQYLCFEVKGDSMETDTDESIPEGSILLCRSVRQDYWKSQLHIKKWDFVIVHREKGIVVKRIIKHDVEAGIITLHSLNSFYSDYDVHLKDVQQIFNIVEVQSKRKRR